MKNLVTESSASPKAKPGTFEAPYLLTTSEIDSLRQEMHTAGVWAKAELSRRYPNREMPTPDRLTNSEIEALRQDRRETHAYCQKLFREMKIR